MKRTSLWVAISLTLSLSMMCFVTVPPAEAGEKIVLNLAHIWGPTHLINVECQHFAKVVAQKSNGLVEIKLFPAQQLAKAKELPEAVSRGTIDMGTIVGPYIAGKMPLIDVDWLPGLYTWDSVGPAHNEMRPLVDKILGKELNMKLLFFFFGGSNELWTVKKPVRKVEDMEGLMIRGAGGVLTQIVKVLGATPVTVSGAEVYTALQRGTIDGCFWGSCSYHSLKAWEVCKYGTKLSNPFGLMFPNVSINLDRWNELAPETQKLLLDCVAETELFCIEAGKKQVTALWEDAEKGGLDIVTMTPEDEKEWIDTAAEVWGWYVKRAGSVGEELLEIAKKHR